MNWGELQVAARNCRNSLCTSAFIQSCWQNTALLTFHLDVFFFLLSLHVSLHWTSMILSLLFLQAKISSKPSGRNSGNCSSVSGLSDWWDLSSDSTHGLHYSPPFRHLLRLSGYCQGEKVEVCLHILWTKLFPALSKFTPCAPTCKAITSCCCTRDSIVSVGGTQGHLVTFESCWEGGETPWRESMSTGTQELWR